MICAVLCYPYGKCFIREACQASAHLRANTTASSSIMMACFPDMQPCMHMYTQKFTHIYPLLRQPE